MQRARRSGARDLGVHKLLPVRVLDWAVGQVEFELRLSLGEREGRLRLGRLELTLGAGGPRTVGLDGAVRETAALATPLCSCSLMGRSVGAVDALAAPKDGSFWSAAWDLLDVGSGLGAGGRVLAGDARSRMAIPSDAMSLSSFWIAVCDA